MSTIRIQALPKFPASVEAGDGILIERSGGVFTFSLDPDVLNGILGDPVEVAHGGTGVATLTDHGVLVGSGADAITPLAIGATNSILQGVTGADPVFTTAPQVSSISVGNSGTPTAPITLNTATSEFFLARPGATIGGLLQMQYGKETLGGLIDGSVGFSGIELNQNFDSGSPVGADERYSSALNVTNNMQSGVGGASLCMFLVARATGTWDPHGSGLGGATALIALGESDRGGDVFGINPFARATTTAAKSVNGMEIDVDVQADAAGTLMKQALQIVDYGTSTGSCVDSVAINVIAQTGAYGFQDGIRFNSSAGAFPLRSNGTILSAQGGTVGAGLDISAMGFSTAHAVLMPNASYLTGKNSAGSKHIKAIGVDGSDFVTLYNGVAKLSPFGTLALGGAGVGTGALALAGMTSGTVTLKAQAIAGAADITFGTTTGTVAASAIPPLAINVTTGVVSITGAVGQVLAGATPAFTATPVLGVAGSTVGTVGFQNATSGTITLSPVAGALGTVTLSLPAATDTLVGKATSDTFTNKTYDTAGTGNVFRINGTQITANTGTGSNVLATAPTLVSTGTGGGAVVVSGSAVSMLNVTGSSGSGQGAQFAMTRGGVQHNFGYASAILGGTSDDFLIYVSGSTTQNCIIYQNGISRLTVQAGVQVGAPTGGDKGAGTLNATAVYDDNTLLTCYPFEQYLDGKIDTAKWDALVPDRKHEIERPFEKVETVIEMRRHDPLRKFAARLGGKHDPMKLESYIKHWREKRHLTSLPNEQTFDPTEGLSTGEWVQRLVETAELQAIHMSQLLGQVEGLETVVQVERSG